MNLELDMRTVSFLLSFFAFTYGVGLFCFYLEQKQHKGLKQIAISLILMSVGVVLLFLRGTIPMSLSIVVSNVLLCLGFSICLLGFCQFREASFLPAKLSLFALLPVFLALVYFYYYDNSINARVVVVSLHLGISQLFASFVIYTGKAQDRRLPTMVLSAAFLLVSITMFIRASIVLQIVELQHYMQGGWVHQIPYLCSMFVIMALSFSLVWLVNGRLTCSIEELVLHDSLTSLYNRRGMDKIVPDMRTRSVRNDESLVVLMCDIDHFKSINDRFGHLKGDEVIVQVSNVIQENLRLKDVAIRYGGEEFLIILPDTCVTEAMDLADRIRHAVWAMATNGQGNENVTISIGSAQCEGEESLESLIKRADRALYEAKKRGRNCVVNDVEFINVQPQVAVI
ncbi:GGDEF domain-containing protein [uncultured Vibrio sp.]|uniref:GGDEF domain-containing protein n=1 Tax=uncultured Vibrio sp. TaxID=114054 RepID=UPI0025FBA50A|nr:GGDEF domain-containing protein [uncultured Vibrio sp.]